MLAGPNIQLPAVNSKMDENGVMSLDWQTFFRSAQAVSFNLSRSGPTADRPTNAMSSRWIGMQFYDTTLGLPIFLHSVNPDVWHDGTGAVV